MVNIIIVEKNGDLKSMKYVPEKDELYKKCKFKKEEGFELRTTWKVKNKYDFEYVSLYARDSGKANTENKYDFPPPIDNVLYFGSCLLIAHNGTDEWTDLSQDEWTQIYEELFGGFENLDASAKEDELEEDELEHVSDELKTKSGYLKDDFVVDDSDGIGSSGNDDEESWQDSTSELDYEEYIYSDED
mgnify:CR=1 FL=1|tara:strand:- start:1683 stop:2246 length:564 start_codon:yes stop_codon:yes gene_type:complete